MERDREPENPGTAVSEVPRTEERPVEGPRHVEYDRPASGSLAERFRDRETRLDVVRFSTPWRPFGLRLRLKVR